MNKINGLSEFAKEYGVDVKTSLRQYATYDQLHPMIDQSAYNAHHFVTREAGVEVTMPAHKFEALISDAELGRELRKLHTHNPAVLEAWDQYRMLVALTSRDNGNPLL